VIGVGEGVSEFRIGDRVACAGIGFASHAEAISVPRNLCVQLPAGVSFEAGAFGTLGAIALQGVRLAEPTLGESIVVIGLGLVGQLTAQLLKANGCRVLGIDLDPERVRLAMQLGADAAYVSGDEVKRAVHDWTRGRGADAVLLTAATDSSEPLRLAGEISRSKGRGDRRIDGHGSAAAAFLHAGAFIESFVSCGPGRYDPEYEERGHDYPIGYVR
jgi:threonine dehydrogenase-like Zn-dependent dehydrogenase